ncbi:hypothetical protein CDAR_87671 [Caerostris darwini]|uniref:Uncharacterized protein n=1 Tax=Caerostris darwini TaxID=1538125 RepID=A0AAV4S2W2_9ARAC|nr:hypothetical protein CDAR_87671 [Caerostris darwini]
MQGGIGTRADGRSEKVKGASSKNLFINQEPNSSILGHTVKTGQCVDLNPSQSRHSDGSSLCSQSSVAENLNRNALHLIKKVTGYSVFQRSVSTEGLQTMARDSE